LLESSLLDESHLRGREARAYTQIATERFAEGAAALRLLISSLPAEPPWMERMSERADALATLAETDPDRARELLARYEAETASALGVEHVP
jgi:hypothetical protein